MSTAISEQINRIKQAKPDIRNVVAEKGVTIPADTPIDEYASYIAQIDTGISIDDVYPVGAIYISYRAASPAQLFGGRWVQIYDRFLLAVGYNYVGGATGGSATVTLTVDQIPSHKHTIKEKWQDNAAVHNHGSMEGYVAQGSNYSEGGVGFTNDTNAMLETGGGQSHSNMPPYLAVYMWRRQS